MQNMTKRLKAVLTGQYDGGGPDPPPMSIIELERRLGLKATQNKESEHAALFSQAQWNSWGMKKLPELTLRKFALKTSVVRRNKAGEPETYQVRGTADVLYAFWGFIRHVTSLKRKRITAPFLLVDPKNVANQ